MTRSGPTRSSGAALGAILLPVAAAVLLYPGYTGDDTYIHLTFVRTLLSGGGIAYNGGAPTYGCTSPLWLLMLALGGRLGLPLVELARSLSLLWTPVLVWAAGRTARRLGAEGPWVTLAMFGVAVNPQLLRWTFTGMESTQAAALSLLAADRYLAERRDPGARPWSGVLLGLAVLTRPELGLLALLVWGDALRRREPLVRQGLRLLATLVPLAIWSRFALVTFGTALPTTLLAKSLDRGGVGGASGALIRASAAVGIVAWPDLVLLAVVGVRRFRSSAPKAAGGEAPPAASGLIWLALWPPLLMASYVLEQVVMVSRYFLAALPFLTVLACVTSSRILKRRRAYPALALYLAASLLLTLVVIRPHTRGFVRGFQASYRQMGRLLAAQAEPEDRVLVADIGILGYESGLQVIDPVGLVTPWLIELREPWRSRTALASRPQYLVDKSPLPRRVRQDILRGFLPPGSKLLMESRIPGVGIAEPATLTVRLYRLDWDRGEERWSRLRMSRSRKKEQNEGP